MSISAKPETYITKRGTPAKRITFQWTEDKIATAAKLWSEGATGPMIAERMGVSRGSVTAIASMHRDLFPSRLTKGKKSEDGRHLEVPEDWLQQAAALWMEGSNANRIAELTGVRPSTAYTRIAARPDLFPEHRLPNPVRSRSGETRLGDELVIYHVKRPHFTGEVHTMPRVSMLIREEA
jgi:hypothetical protein